MSASAAPISAARFAAALPDLPLSSLYGKVAEIKNSIAHLEISNIELQSYADNGDQDCESAIQENLAVIERMNERVQLLKQELESRGSRINDSATPTNGATDTTGMNTYTPEVINPDANGESYTTSITGTENFTTANGRIEGGRLNDEDLARLMRERLEQYDDGLHL